MKLIRPETITDSIFQSSTVAETDEAEWASGTTYADGDLVMVTSTAGGAATATHKIYESQAGSNTGNDPTIDDGTYWTEVSSTNSCDLLGATTTEAAFRGPPPTDTTPLTDVQSMCTKPVLVPVLRTVSVLCVN